MFLKVTKSPIELAEDFPIDDDTVDAIRFMDERARSVLGLLRETSYELAQYQTRCELLEQRLKKYEEVDEFDPKPYIHIEVEL